MKKTCLFIFLVSLVLVFSACQENFSDRCLREAKEYTRKNCPKQLQPEIRMDSLTFSANSQTLKYYYTLFGKLDDVSAVENAKDQMRVTMLNALKNDVSLRLYKSHDLSFEYIWYSASQKNKLLDITFTAEEYK